MSWLISWIIPVLAFVFVLGSVVVLHEFGHFIIAKFFKIRVETFSVGFGPRLLGFRWGTTDYRVSAIPLGGYVKLGGDESNAAIEGAGSEDIPVAERFSLRPGYQRILVALGGPIANVLTALAVPFLFAMVNGIQVEPPNPAVGQVLKDSAAQEAGILPGDKIVSLEGKENPTWSDIQDAAVLVTNPPTQIPIVVERNGQRIPLKLTPKSVRVFSDDVGETGIIPDYGTVPVMIARLEPGKPAAAAGLQPGDRLMAINGEQIRNRTQATVVLRAIHDPQVKLTIERQGKQLDITSGLVKITDENGKEISQVGVNLEDDLPRVHVGPASAFTFAVGENVRIIKLTGKALGQVFAGQRKARDTVAGPIGIATYAAQAAQLGFGAVITLIAGLSLSLGVFNLLPIPVLDGGAIFLILVEAVLGLIGMKLTVTVRERIQQVGFVLLLLLMGFVITNDIIKKAVTARESNAPPPATAPSPVTVPPGPASSPAPTTAPPAAPQK
jgi:regulator of sigma E protease